MDQSVSNPNSKFFLDSGALRSLQPKLDMTQSMGMKQQKTALIAIKFKQIKKCLHRKNWCSSGALCDFNLRKYVKAHLNL